VLGATLHYAQKAGPFWIPPCCPYGRVKLHSLLPAVTLLSLFTLVNKLISLGRYTFTPLIKISHVVILSSLSNTNTFVLVLKCVYTMFFLAGVAIFVYLLFNGTKEMD
jgi:hypothetical protein